MTMTLAINGGEVEVPDGASVLEVALSPGDGERYGVADGEWIRLASRRGELEGRATYSEKMRAGEVFVPIVKLRDHAANFLTNSAYDPNPKIPEYKVCAVRLEKVGGEAREGKRRKHDRNTS